MTDNVTMLKLSIMLWRDKLTDATSFQSHGTFKNGRWTCRIVKLAYCSGPAVQARSAAQWNTPDQTDLVWKLNFDHVWAHQCRHCSFVLST